MSGADNNRRINFMARTIRAKIYKFDELSKDAQLKAVEWFLDGEDFSWITDPATNTLNKFCEIFDIKYREFDYCEHYRSRYSFDMEDNILLLSGQRLATYIWNNFKTQLYKGKYFSLWSKTEKSYKHYKEGYPVLKSRYSKVILDNSCPLTGWCYDNSVLQPIYDFMAKPSPDMEFRDLLNICLSELAKDVCSEIKANHEFEAVADTIRANDYEFTKDGKHFI